MNENHRHNSNIVNWTSSLRAKEENLNDVCLESSQPAVVKHGEGSQDSNKVKTKVEPSSMHRETVASSIWVAAASSESSSGGNSNPTSIQLKAKSIYVKKEIPKEYRFWTIIPGCPKCKRDSFEIRISECVTEMVRFHDQDERETDGARHWDGVLSVLKGKFRNQMEKEFTDEDWLHCLYLGSIKTRFEICKDENGEIRHIRAIQGHSGGMIVSPRLMNYVRIPYKWKRFIYHVGRARDENSSAEIGLVAGGKGHKEGRQTIFFTPLDPFNSDADEAESTTDTTKLRKVQYQIHWRPGQDAVYLIHLSTAQDAGLEFWQTGSNAIITYQSVPQNASSRLSAKVGKENCSRDSKHLENDQK